VRRRSNSACSSSRINPGARVSDREDRTPHIGNTIALLSLSSAVASFVLESQDTQPIASVTERLTLDCRQANMVAGTGLFALRSLVSEGWDYARTSLVVSNLAFLELSGAGSMFAPVSTTILRNMAELRRFQIIQCFIDIVVEVRRKIVAKTSYDFKFAVDSRLGHFLV